MNNNFYTWLIPSQINRAFWSTVSELPKKFMVENLNIYNDRCEILALHINYFSEHIFLGKNGPSTYFHASFFCTLKSMAMFEHYYLKAY